MHINYITTKNNLPGDASVTESQLVLEHDANIDEPFYNLMRRLIIRDAKRDIFKTIITDVYESDVPEDAVRHTIHMLPVKGPGSYELKIEATEGTRRVTSSDIDGKGQIEPDIPIVTLAEGKRLHMRLQVESVMGVDHPGTEPFLLTRDGDPSMHILEPLASIYGKKDCVDAIRDCLNTIRGYVDTIDRALDDV